MRAWTRESRHILEIMMASATSYTKVSQIYLQKDTWTSFISHAFSNNCHRFFLRHFLKDKKVLENAVINSVEPGNGRAERLKNTMMRIVYSVVLPYKAWLQRAWDYCVFNKLTMKPHIAQGTKTVSKVFHFSPAAPLPRGFLKLSLSHETSDFPQLRKISKGMRPKHFISIFSDDL